MENAIKSITRITKSDRGISQSELKGSTINWIPPPFCKKAHLVRWIIYFVGGPLDVLEVPCHEKDVLRKEWEFEICRETHSKAQ